MTRPPHTHVTALIEQTARALIPQAFTLMDLVRHPDFAHLEFKQVQSGLQNARSVGDVRRVARGIYVHVLAPEGLPPMTALARAALTAADRRHINEHGTCPPARENPARGSRAQAKTPQRPAPPPSPTRAKRPPAPETVAARDAVREALRGHAGLNAYRIARVTGLDVAAVNEHLDQLVWDGEVVAASHVFATYRMRVPS